jgi:S1-C subfamily serine protease
LALLGAPCYSIYIVVPKSGLYERGLEALGNLSTRGKAKLTLLVVTAIVTILNAMCSYLVPLPEYPSPELICSHVKVGYLKAKKGTAQEQMTHSGSGVIVAQGVERTYILTVRHAVKAPKLSKDYVGRLVVWAKEDGAPIEARIEEVSDEIDAATISTPNIKGCTAKVSKRGPREGREVFVFGAPLPEFRTVVRRRIDGECASRRRSELHHRSKCFQLNSFIRHGFSGGGVFNSSGELVGICRALLPQDNDRGLCIPIKILEPMIDLCEQKTMSADHTKQSTSLSHLPPCGTSC